MKKTEQCEKSRESIFIILLKCSFEEELIIVEYVSMYLKLNFS